MNPRPSRRSLLAAAAVASLAPRTLLGQTPLAGKIRKAMIVGPATEATLTPIKEAGFAGVETYTYNVTEADAAHLRSVADRLNMRIHSVMRGWAEFNSDDPARVTATLEETRQSMRAAHWYGADDILLVPCKLTGDIAVPPPGDFDIEFDPKTLHVSRVVEGDNAPYAAYIAAQNKATDMSRKAVEQLIPLAEELKIIIAIENVWNNFWVQPRLAKALVESFNHPMVRAYFDIGNHVKYRRTPVQDWIKILGPLIVRLHIKDYKLGPTTAEDKWAHPRDGSIDWPAVRQALSDINFDGWASIEDQGLPLPEFSHRFDLILEGK